VIGGKSSLFGEVFDSGPCCAADLACVVATISALQMARTSLGEGHGWADRALALVPQSGPP